MAKPTISRRAILAATPAIIVAPIAAVAAPNADADLLALCAEYFDARKVADEAQAAVPKGWGISDADLLAYCQLPQEQQTTERLNALMSSQHVAATDRSEAAWDVVADLSRRILPIVPATAAGCLAKLRVALREAGIEDTLPRVDQDWHEEYLNVVADNLAGIAGASA